MRYYYRNLVILIMTFGSAVASAKEGGVVGNGGDGYSIQFIKVAQQVVQYLADAKAQQIDVNKFKLAVETTKVESTNKDLEINGIPKDAINYPQEKRIVFARKSWNRISEDIQRAVLVFHEYLGILGTDDTGYKISKSILQDLYYGRASGYEAQDAGSPKVIRTWIRGEIAKKMYSHLAVPVETISGIDGEQQTKFGKGIECAMMSGTKEYSCYFDVNSAGID